MRELNTCEIEEVNGGNPVYIAIAVVAGYAAILDAAYDFGKGLGAGLYDALN